MTPSRIEPSLSIDDDDDTQIPNAVEPIDVGSDGSTPRLNLPVDGGDARDVPPARASPPVSPPPVSPHASLTDSAEVPLTGNAQLDPHWTLVQAKLAIQASHQTSLQHASSKKKSFTPSPTIARLPLKDYDSLTVRRGASLDSSLEHPNAPDYSDCNDFVELSTEPELVMEQVPPILPVLDAELAPNDASEIRHGHGPVSAIQAQHVKVIPPLNRPTRVTACGIILIVVVIVATAVGLTRPWSTSASRVPIRATLSLVATTQTPTVTLASTASPTAPPTPLTLVILPDGRTAFTSTALLCRAVDAYFAVQRTTRDTLATSDVARQYGYPMGTWDVSRACNDLIASWIRSAKTTCGTCIECPVPIRP